VEGAAGEPLRDAHRTPAPIVTLDRYELGLTVAGFAALLAAWLPAYTARRPFSLPLALVALGLAVFLLPLGFDAPDPREHLEVTERFTELGVIVALMGAGLKLDRPVGWRRWSTTWRLLAIAMPLTIVAVALLGWSLLGLPLSAALLLGAVLAPTDPVLASDVQVGEPTLEGDEPEVAEDEVRFALTSEGGLNDALAFPVVYAAVAAATGGAGSDWILEWFAVDVLYRLAVGVLVGVLVGRLLGVVAFRPPGRLSGLAETAQGFAAVGLTLLAYGLTELVHGYGFLAVFVAAVALRSSERRHEFHGVLHAFIEQAEHLLVVGLLIALGGSLAAGILAGLGWREVLVVGAVVLIVRPVSGRVALLGSRCDRSQRWAISFFGVRGIGSLYYLSYALSEHDFSGAETLWAVVTATIVASVVVHGITATPAMGAVDRVQDRRRRRRVSTVAADVAPRRSGSTRR
jgi:NhaP-type Na+/H+ or K+/H+ antiporter